MSATMISLPEVQRKLATSRPIQILSKVHFELVYGCQLQCVGCPISTLKPKVKRTDPEVFRQCMTNVDVKGIRFLRLFNFGETLLHDRLSDIMKIIPTLPYAVDNVEISTNGQFAHWNDLEEVFKTRRLDQLAVSCDGDGTPETYERLRPPSEWEKLMEFLERARALRDKHSPHTRLITRTVCESAEEQARWRRVLEPRGFTPEFRGWLVLADAKENVLGDDYTIPKNVCRFMTRFDGLYIDWDGTVVPCCAHPSAGDFGSLKTQKFSEIVYGDPRFGMIDRMRRDRASMRVCGDCGVS